MNYISRRPPTCIRQIALGAAIFLGLRAGPAAAQPRGTPAGVSNLPSVLSPPAQRGASASAPASRREVPKAGATALAGKSRFQEDEDEDGPPVKVPPFAVSMAKAKALKAKGDYRGAQLALYDAKFANSRDPHPSYLLAWIAVAQKRRSTAIYYFRCALRDGMRGKDAVEARAALQRMGATVAFPKFVPRKRSPLQQLTTQMMLMDILRPTPAAWARRTFFVLAGFAVAWGVIALLIAFAAQERPDDFEIKYLAFWCLTLFGLMAAGQFWLSYRFIFPLILAYLALACGQFLSPLGYGFRRLTTKKVTDRGAIVCWGVFYTLVFLDIIGGKSFLTPYFLGITGVAALVWLWLNPWVFAGQRAQLLKNKGDLSGAIQVMERQLEKPRISQKTRFVMLNDISSFYMTMNRPIKSLETAKRALEHVSAFKTAEVLPHFNMAEAHLSLGRYESAVDELAQVWHLTESGDCIMGNDMWKGKTHGMLASLNYWRGWMDEAERQSDLCLEAFPAEKRTSQSIKNSVGSCRAIKAAVRLANGDLETAQRYAAAAPKAGPKQSALAFCHYVAGLLARAEGQLAVATTQAGAALTVSPSYFPAQVLLAELHADAGAQHQAAPALAAALEKHGSHLMAPQARQLLVSWGHPLPEMAEAIPMESLPEPFAPAGLTV